MANEVFKRETLLDLVVNGVPLFIMLFFIGLFLALPVFGFDWLEVTLQFGIIVVSFVSLVVLTYVAAVAIVRAEENGTVYIPGQANVVGSKPIEEREDERQLEAREGTLVEDDAEPAGELADADDRADDGEQVDTDERADDADGSAAVERAIADEETSGEDESEQRSTEQRSADEDRGR